jgi:hypothetical protein
MPRRITLCHLRRDLRRLSSTCDPGFTLTPTGVHPFGTSNHQPCSGTTSWSCWPSPTLPPYRRPRLAVSASLPQPEFSCYRGRDVDAGLAWRRRACRRRPLRGKWHGRLAPFDFGRDAVLQAGGRLGLSFRSPSPPTRHARDRFLHLPTASSAGTVLKPDYQRHPNGALRVVEVVMSAPEPAAHAFAQP